MAAELPAGFVYLRQVDPGIAQDIRYAGRHNFVGRPIAGYDAAECILTSEAAAALARVQARLTPEGLSLIVWDCYRPARAVADFKQWSLDLADQSMKAEFYPRADKARFFKDGYLASRSKHSSGSTVDLGIVDKAYVDSPPLPVPTPLVACDAPLDQRYNDHALDFGTGYDCLDPASGAGNAALGAVAAANRAALATMMGNEGFVGYSKEWWHFELSPEPFAKQYFDFPVAPLPKAP